MPPIRLNKLLSRMGVASRRVADALIAQGRVEVNGQPVSQLGSKADPSHDDIRVDGRRLKAPPARRYLLLNKPRGVVSTRVDPQRRQTVADLLVRAGIDGYFYPVGRLDYDSEGLLILTNDGDFAARVAHPRYELPRTYEIVVAGLPDDRDLDRLRKGIALDDGRTRPATVKFVRSITERDGEHAVLEMTLHEGRNRQVRRMCDAIAHPVDRLRRVRIGSITDRALKTGQLRDLTPSEVRALTSPAETAAGPPRRRARPSAPAAASQDHRRSDHRPSRRR